MAQAAKLCSANLACGTKILIGPRTFLLAGKEIVARPLDLLEGSPGQTFEEIYELKSL